MDEPKMTINGTELTSRQAMAVRVAITEFDFNLYEAGCGGDKHGKEMNALYKERMRELYKLMGL